ncbi:type II toxin-antitoxin system mRNA interferase toxin, RelE/StbE family [Candidatus Parcubacteria bacterium]|nr:type II toxin-antitoxin system mRNA interferase toxin, RelE/StbE family [Candidatus Parcubacteria bacterium]
MKIKYHKRFEKQFKKLLDRDKKKVINVIEIFVKNVEHLNLRNHKLKGNLAGKRAISAGSDLRIIFEEFDSYTLVIFLDLGKHNRVYK